MQRLSRSVRFDEVLEEDKARMDARISSLTSQCDAKKTELNRMLVRLTDADFWPVGQKMPPTLEDGHAAMQTTINELKKSLASLYKLIEDTRADFAKSRETQATAFTDSEGNQTTEPRAAKRRRLSSGDDTLVEDEDRKRAMVTAAEVDELRGKLLEVERQLADVQNEMVQHDNELLQEIEDLVHSRLEDIPGSASTSRGGRAPDNDPKKQRDNVLDHIRRDLDSTGNDILSLAQEVAGLIKQMNAKDQEQTNLRLENEQLKQRVEAVCNCSNPSSMVIDCLRSSNNSIYWTWRPSMQIGLRCRPSTLLSQLSYHSLIHLLLLCHLNLYLRRLPRIYIRSLNIYFQKISSPSCKKVIRRSQTCYKNPLSMHGETFCPD